MLNKKRREKIIFLVLLFISFATPCFGFSGYPPQEGVYIFEEKSGDVIFAQNENQLFSPASTTKLMTSIILLENVKDLNQPVICGSEVLDYDFNDSEAGYWENQQTTYAELINAMLIPSGNDAAGTIAVNVGRILLNDPNADKVTAQAAFVDAMNKKAEDLGLENTHFTNPAGQEDPNHKTTPKDFAKIASEAYKYPEVIQACQTKVYPITSIKGYTYDLINTDVILFPTMGELGITPDPNLPPEQQQQALTSPNPFYTDLLKAGKTGTTGENTRTFVFTSDIGDAEIIGVLFNYPDSNIFAQAKSALEEINTNFSLSNLQEKLNGDVRLKNSNFIGGNLSYSATETNLGFLPNDKNNLTQNIRWNKNYIEEEENDLIQVKDINQGDKIGSIVLSNDNSIIKTVPIYANNSVKINSGINFFLIPVILIGIIILVQIIKALNNLVNKSKNNKKETVRY